ncbi:helix-turn-helix domain-containing protein [Microbacterium abyssi]|uniref:helix-turn-helix domain-containing protein n=1 Tax=Microbacterium abyssi TaxID=2782166 RepID=UPI0018881387|nr:helix-turn-helix transcriptional regulator [Microbacterium sp. A18JL241]
MGLFPTDDPQYKAVYAEEAAMVDASEIIARALEASGLSRADLARSLNVTRSEVTERLRGDRNITIRNLAATLHALGAELQVGARIPEAHAVAEPIDLAKYAGWESPSVHAAHEKELPSVSSYRRPAAARYRKRVGA